MNFNDIINLLRSTKKVVEFGGPSDLFVNQLKLYDSLNQIDGFNIFDNNVFNKNINNDFIINGKVKGKRYDIDVGSDKILNMNNDIKYDCIIASHIIEHLANPIKSLIMWKKLLNRNGYLLSIIPDKDYTFDHKRKLTNLEHLKDDFDKNVKEDDITHIQEIEDLHDDSKCGMNIREYLKENYKYRVAHHHCFNEDLITNMFAFCGYDIIIHFKESFNIITLSKIKDYE